MNALGVDVRGLDTDAFLATARLLFPFLALAWLALVGWKRRPGLLLLGVLLGNAYVWVETNWPLQRLYALGVSSDRVNNVALCQVVAAGHSPLHTPQVGQLHFEPFWAVVTAVLAGWDTQRLLALYPFLALITAAGFALSLYLGLRPPPSPAEEDGTDGGWSRWECALVALFATLLSSAPLDYASPYRVPWAMTFLLKPNHAVGLVLFPWVLRAFVRRAGWRGRILAGLLLHVLGWAFVIHMGAVCVGLVCYALLVTLLRREEAREAWTDVAVVIGINLLVVSPYLVMLFSGYGVFHSGPRMQIPPASPHLLEALTRVGVLAPLAGWGAVAAWRRDRLGRVWAAQLAGALLVWLAYYPLSLLSQAKERDDTYYWLRIHIAVAAAIGAWDLSRRLLSPWWPALAPPARRAALIGALSLPFLLPYWWDPVRMDLYFPGSLSPLPETVTRPAAWLRDNGGHRAVVAGDVTAARWMAALAGTPVLLARDFAIPSGYGEKLRLGHDLVRGGPGDPPAQAKRLGVSHLVVTPEYLAALETRLEEVESRPYLRPASFGGERRGDFVALFAVVAPSS